MPQQKKGSAVLMNRQSPYSLNVDSHCTASRTRSIGRGREILALCVEIITLPGSRGHSDGADILRRALTQLSARQAILTAHPAWPEAR